MRKFQLLSIVLLVGCNVGDDSEPIPPIENVEFTCQPATCDTNCSGGKLDGDSLVTPVDRDRGLRADWVPRDLVRLPNAYRTGAGDYLRLRAATAFIALADAAYLAGHDLYCGSTYRSFETQCSLFGSYALTDGCQQANTYSARAGHSEHQLGTTCDIFVDGDFLAADSPASHWLDAHAHEYGFALSYPPGSECTTLYQHEPWHWRYVGPQATALLRTRESSLGRRISTHELVAEHIAPEQVSAIDVDAVERPEDVALVCAKCGDACFANPLSLGPDRCD